MAWTISFHEAARSEFLDLPIDLQARLERIAALIEPQGLERLPGKFARHIEGRLWELRLKGLVGVAPQGQRRDRSGTLRDHGRSADRDRAGLRQEDAEDAAPRNQACARTRQEVE
jgi:hypothetical protein